MFTWPPKVSLGLGTMHWGTTPLDKVIAGKIITDEEISLIQNRAASAGVTFIDTAEGYGGGSSERRLGRLRFSQSGFLIATKFIPTYWRWTPQAVVRAIRASNRRLGIESCDLGFVHSPIHPRSPDVWIKGFARAHEAKLIKAVGLSNFNAEQVRQAAQVAKEEGVPLVANQIQFNLLVAASTSLKETVQACHENGLTVVGYSVLGQGLLTDGLTERRWDKSVLAKRLKLSREELTPLRNTILKIAQNRNCRMSQVCLAWARAHHVVPLVGTRSLSQWEDSLDGLGVTLTQDETQELDSLALGRSTFDRARSQRLLILGFLSLLMTAYKVSSVFRAR
ncbi:MAG: hypothetical protein HKM05_03320 [Spirochaetales bacterium]|nr:hypothetical protein [Spirochaetales bacterium]